MERGGGHFASDKREVNREEADRIRDAARKIAVLGLVHRKNQTLM